MGREYRVIRVHLEISNNKHNPQQSLPHPPQQASCRPNHHPPPPPLSNMSEQIIVLGGGLAGLSAAHTVLEHGGRVLLLDKNPFLGGNSTKATSGINGALTRTQARLGIDDR